MSIGLHRLPVRASEATLSLECGRSTSRVSLPEQSWRQGQTIFMLNVREEAVAV